MGMDTVSDVETSLLPVVSNRKHGKLPLEALSMAHTKWEPVRWSEPAQ